jgi:hypothetical protein
MKNKLQVLSFLLTFFSVVFAHAVFGCDLTATVANITPTSCYAQANGSVSVNASNGTPAYNYSWAAGVEASPSSIITGLSEGSYIITVTDAAGCTATVNATITGPTVITIGGASVPTPPTCGASNGVVNIYPSGGAGAYSYSWNGSTGTATIVDNLSAGVYTVTVIDASGCTTSTIIDVNNTNAAYPSIPNFTPVTCYGDSNGYASAIASGGTGALNYSWSNGQTTAAATNLSANTYTVTVTDALGCMGFSTIAITQSPAIQVSASSSSNLTCSTMSVVLTGTSTNNTLVWNGPSVNAAADPVTVYGAGTYTVTATNTTNGCTASSTVIVTNDTAAPTISIAPANAQLTCAAANISLTGSSTTVGAYFQWTGGPATAIDNVFNPGSYTLKVTDPSNGCTASQTATVTINTTAPTVTAVSSGNISCTVTSVVLTGTSPGDTMAWSGPQLDSVPNPASAHVTGTYTVTATNPDNGCKATSTVSIIQVPGIFIQTKSVRPISGSCDGSASASVTGGRAPFMFNWSTGDFTSMLNNLCAGTYTVTIHDAGNCRDSAVVMVHDSSGGINKCSNLAVTIAGTNTLISSCNGYATSTVNGGTPPYNYSWSNFFSSQSIANLCPGNYALTVADINGCSTSANIKILGDTASTSFPLTIFVNTTDASAASNCDGSAHITVSGGVPPYTYAYSNGSTTAKANALCPFYYSVLVTDNKGNTDSVNFVISAPKLILKDTNSTQQKSLADSSLVATIPASAVPDCNINPSSVDSVTIAGFSFISMDSIAVIWNVYVGANPTQITNKYTIGQSGVYALVFELFCNGSGLRTTATNSGFIKAVVRVYVTIPITTGITDNTINTTRVFPIPFTDILTVNPSGTDVRTASVFDVCGKSVLNPILLGGQSSYTINLSTLSPGYYLLKVASPSNVEFIKIVKE